MTDLLRFTILGCGSSGGVPRTGGEWGRCDPANPKNRRRRCSLLVERIGADGTTRVLVDTGPDMREQLLSANVRSIDGVVYTHAHADHIHGIDDLRGFALSLRRRIDVFMDEPTRARADEAFSYCFKGAGPYPPILNAHHMQAGENVVVEGQGGPITLTPFLQHHGNIDSLGFRVGDVAYSSDLHDVPDASLHDLSGLSVWIVDALRWTPHSSHFNVEQALDWIGRVGARRGVLTNLLHDLDYEELAAHLPEHVEPAFDMMVIERKL